MRRTIESGTTTAKKFIRSLFLLLVFQLIVGAAYSQCETISGNVFESTSNEGVPNVLVKAFGSNGELSDQQMTDFFGNYEFLNLSENSSYRVEFVYSGTYRPAAHGEGNSTSVQFVTSPACNVSFGLVDPADFCAANAQVALTCFVQGGPGENDDVETLVYTDYDFNLDSKVNKFAMKSQTGSVWGLAWKNASRELFSAAFIKQYAGLTEHGHSAIFSTNTSTGVSTLHARLDELGQEVGTVITDQDHVDYGAQTGKIGLGGLEISEDGETLYVINIYNNTLVSLSSSNPSPETTRAFTIPNPNCFGGDNYRAFALSRSGNKLLVGVTCTSTILKAEGELSVTVFEFDLNSEEFTNIFSTDYPKGFWRDTPASSTKTQHWLTDLAMTDEGNMILSLSDRISHRYHNVTTNGRLDDQHPDILIAYQNNGVWTLENNGFAGDLEGSHPNQIDGEGPGGGEFFGFDYWISGPVYHSEIATGSVMVMPGDGSVVATVFDPDFDSYTGGLHKYSTTDGSKLGVAIVYEHTNDPQFGKASGLGDMVAMCADLPLEIGNLLWIDTDNDGVQDAGEPFLPNIDLKLYDSNCVEVGSTTTDENGNYYFNNTNVDLNGDGSFDGLAALSDYYVVVSDDAFNASNALLVYNEASYLLTKKGIGFGTNADINDSDASLTDSCEDFQGSPSIKFTTGDTGNSDHTFDIGFSPAAEGDFDLALRKELVSDFVAKYGEPVEFKITVFNQGAVTAHEILVNDYLADGYTFDENLNPGWKMDDGVLQTLVGNPLLPSSEVELTLVLIVKEGASPSELINIAEIGGAFDQDGEVLDDIDSTPDNIPDNDNGGVLFQATDDEINDDGSIDEDDHDPAAVGIFDLALRKQLVNPGTPASSNSSVDFIITVFNQGSVGAESITISDYLPAELIFNPDINDGWELLDDSTITYVIAEGLSPLSSVNVELTLETGNISGDNDIVNYAEIRTATDDYGNTDSDVDSSPDGIRGNDNGGSPYDATDNEIGDNGEIDEDDHDPALLNFMLFDLALRKTTLSSSVKAGENVDFKITIINQGDVAASSIGLVDYIPESMTLNDPTWTMYGDDMAKMDIDVPGGLNPGDSTSANIRLKVSDDFMAGTLINFAEIDHVFGLNGLDLSLSDVDSRPDDQRTNDIGGLPFSPTDNEINDRGLIDEDDHDPAFVYVFSALINESCICLENASETEQGQFGDLIQIIAPSGLEWYVHQADGLFDAGITTPGVPTGTDFPTGVQYPMTEFMTGPSGYMLVEYPIGTTGNSEYYVIGVRQDGEPYEVVIRNNIGDQEIITGGACNYDTNTFEAAAGVCTGSLVTYCVEDFSNGASNQWVVSGDAMIVGPSDEECVNVQYGATVGDEVSIVFNSNSLNSCYSPAMASVTIGESAGTLSCLANVNISLDDDCDVGLTAASLLTTEVTPGAVYSIIYTNTYGFMLGDNIDWNTYVGQEVVAKVMDNCSGNSCWSFINIEDKKAPEIECFDLTVSCIEMMDYNGPFVLDNCSGEATLNPGGSTQEALDCDPDFAYRLTRTFRAQDEYGNLSDPCTQTILVERPELDSIVAPEDYTMENGLAFSCNYLDTIADGGILDPLLYGVPTLEGVPLYPSAGQFCNIGVNYKDVVFASTGCVTKIMRQWIIFEWYCEFGELDTITQFFNIADMEDPSITCLGDISVSSNGSTCEGTVILPAAVVSDDCTAEPRVDIAYPGGFLEDSNGGSISLPLGVHEVTYTVTDDCFNSVSCTIMVTVEDNTPPVPVCHHSTVLSVRTDGTTYALASSFNDGSYDDCSPITLDVRRMDGGAACVADTIYPFRDRVEFCCADVGEEVMVVLRVTDAESNANQCMVSVQIQDKNPPSVTAPVDMTVDCLQALDLSNLSQFGEAIATDNCNDPVITEEVFSGLNVCRTGIIERRFTATDGNGTAFASQFITVITEDTFDIDNIKWPEDYTTSAACDPGSLKPENLPEENGFPMLLGEGFCSQAAITYSDKVFDIINSETTCQKIIRSWIVEDFCQPLGGQAEFASWRFDQVIEISNDVAPVLTSICEDITICSFNENCMTGAVTLTAGASDDCTPGDMMRYSYFIDFDQNGVIDIQDIGRGDSITVVGEYPIGSHSILYRFMDLCGNVVTCRQQFTIENCVKPNVVCHDGLSVGLVAMDTDGDGIVDDEMAIVKARTFDASSFHPCGDDLIYSFTENPMDSCITFDCDSIGLRDVTIYAITPSGVSNFCVTNIDVQDNNDVDLCRGVEDCIVMPVDITINECADDFSPETIGGGPTIDPDCICTMTTIDFTDRDSTDVNNTCTTIIRDWTVTFNCGQPMVFTSTQVITIFDSRPPIVACPDNVTVASGVDACSGTVVVGIPTVLSDCTTEFTISSDSEFADSNFGAASGIYPVGIDTFIYTISDKCENQSFCEVTVLVTDNANPICDVNDVTVNVTDALIDVTVDPNLIDNGSFDECGMVVERVLSPTSFGCDDAGTVQDVTLSITDDSGNTTDCFAQVTVRDSVPPVCMTVTRNVNLFDDAMVTLPAGLLNDGSFDLCGELASIQIMNNGFNCERLGVQTVILRLVDDSGNVTDCEQDVTVFDRGAPDCILMDITVQLDGNNQATISGEDLDDGSFDICSGLDTIILDRTTFGCEDIGDNLVSVEVVDSSGNTTDCAAMVSIESGGVLMCLVNDITIYLEEDGEVMIEPSDVDGGSGVPCAEDAIKTIDRSTFFCNDVGIPREVTLTVMSSLGDTSCVAMVMVLDTISPMLTCPADLTVNCADLEDDLTAYGNVSTIGSNCSVLTEDINDSEVFELNDCGLGTITRTFDATDINGNISICSQVITVTSGSSFTEDNITWPTDTLTLEQCISIDPDTIGSRPMVSIPDSMCTNLGFAYEDVSLTNNVNCQDTVRRTWMVIDSCPTPFNVFSFEQIIIVNDEMAPMIVAEDTLFLCDTLITFDVVVADCNEVTLDYTSDVVSGTGTTISGEFPEGNTTVNLTATDRCGNTTEDSIIVNIQLDTIPPSALCISRTVRIEEDGETIVTPHDTEWYLRVNDNTTDSTDLMYSFNPSFDMSLDTLRFNCDSVMIKSHAVEIFIKDKGGNVFRCTPSYVVTDPNGVCTGNLASIQGRVKTELSVEIPEVKMNLINGDMSEMTDNSGFYNFPPMEGEAVYELRPEKDTEHMQGVTSLDLVLIQRHILGTQNLSSAYQIIAADINKTGSVTGKDLLDLRKNILGLVDAFPNNKSWRFVDEDYSFIDAANPFSEIFPESYMIYDMAAPVSKNFIGVKVGDVNGSITLKSDANAVNRSSPILVSVDDRKVGNGEAIVVPVVLTETMSMAGGQLSFELDPSIKVTDISSDELDINSSDYSIRKVGTKNIITIVMLPTQDLELEVGSVLLEIALESTISTTLSESFAINEDFRNELYTAGLEVRDVNLRVGGLEEVLASDLLLQNTPNPWKDKTVISFELASAQSATINVYTVTGALVTTINGDYEAGRNEVEVKSSEFSGNGVFYYELVTDEARISKRMIRLK